MNNKWVRIENVYWADFSNSAGQHHKPPPTVDPGNAALAYDAPPDRRAVVERIERRIDGVLLDVLQGHERIVRALADHDAKAQSWRSVLSSIENALELLRAEMVGRFAERTAQVSSEIEAVRQELNVCCVPARAASIAAPPPEPPRPKKGGRRRKAIGALIVTLHALSPAIASHAVVRHALGDSGDITVHDCATSAESYPFERRRR